MNKMNFSLMIFLALTLAVGVNPAGAEELTVRAVVEGQDVFVGDSFDFQIQVSGNDEPSAPILSGLADFEVQALGGQKNNSESVSIINGQMTREVRRGYVYAYRLTPKREGDLVIPSIDIHAGGRTVKTQPILLHAAKPQENETFKLRLTLSREKCYVNEPVTLTVTWYIGKDFRNFEFSLPILGNKNFTFISQEPQIDPRKRYVRIPLAGSLVIGEIGQGTLDGKTYTTVIFQKILIPKQPGTFEIPRATVACNALMGGFDDDFLGRGNGTYKKFVTPSNGLTLQVTELPAVGRPANFSGLVGTYRMDAAATPTQVNVGDPITLTVRIRGPEYLKQVELPPLSRQPAMARDFKIPQDMAPGKIEGFTKVFTQTIRALNAHVTEIPAIDLSFFDSTAGKYKIARTKPIPLVVKETKVITIRDAEGRELAPVQNELKAWQEGIAHNYEDLGALDNQEFGLPTLIRSPVYLALGIVPPATWLVLLISTVVYRARRADPQAVKARGAYGELTKRIKICLKDDQNKDAKLLEAARIYLGSKLRLVPGSLTWRDVEPRLTERRIDDEILRGLKGVFDECEARRYAGPEESSAGLAATAQRLLDLARKLERRLK
jgi:hypothetical protein